MLVSQMTIISIVFGFHVNGFVSALKSFRDVKFSVDFGLDRTNMDR